jgi:hypothetical protein
MSVLPIPVPDGYSLDPKVTNLKGMALDIRICCRLFSTLGSVARKLNTPQHLFMPPIIFDSRFRDTKTKITAVPGERR